jgi:hypothetical protein
LLAYKAVTVLVLAPSSDDLPDNLVLLPSNPFHLGGSSKITDCRIFQLLVFHCREKCRYSPAGVL